MVDREIAHRQTVAMERIGTALLRLAGAAEKGATAYEKQVDFLTRETARGRARRPRG